MQNSAERPPVRVNNRRDLLVLDRDLQKLPDAYILFAGIPCKEIKFGYSSPNSKIRKVTAEETAQFSWSERGEIVEDMVPAMADLLHGFSFPVSVTHFRFWIEEASISAASTVPPRQIDIVDLRRTTKAVKEVRFDTAVVIMPNFRYRISFTPNPREFWGDKVGFDYADDNCKQLLSAHLTLSMLADDERKNLHDGLTSKTFQPLPSSAAPAEVEKDTPIEDRKPQYSKKERWLPINIKPTVILRDGSVYDKNNVEIDLEEFTLRKQ